MFFLVSFRFQSTSSTKCSFGLAVNSFDDKIKLCRSLRVALGFQFDVDKVPSSPVPQNNLVFSAFFEFEMKKSGPSP